MACANSTTARSSKKARVSRASAEAFMGKLFDLLPDAELSDPEMKRLEGKAGRAERNKRHEAWHIGMLRVWVAEHLYQAVSFARVLEFRTVKRRNSATNCPATDAALKARQAARDQQMLVPVAAAENLKWKRKHLLVERNPWAAGRTTRTP